MSEFVLYGLVRTDAERRRLDERIKYLVAVRGLTYFAAMRTAKAEERLGCLPEESQ